MMRPLSTVLFVVLISVGSLIWDTPAYASVWQDTWQRTDVDIAGECQQVRECGSYIPISCDVLSNRYRTFSSAIPECSQHPSSCVATDPARQTLYFHGEDRWHNNSTGGEGFPMISRKQFNKVT